jgi:hypothetical protein
VGAEPSDCGVLTNIYAGTDETLAVDKVLEGEGQVRRLLQRLLGALEGLNEPFSKAYKVLA